MNHSSTNNDDQGIQPKKASSKALKNNFKKADWALSRLIAFLFNTTIVLVLITLSFTSLSFEFINIFEYHEGLTDISTIEIIFFISSFLLLKRYWAYTKQTSLRWWHRLSAPLIWYGKFILFALLCAALIAFTDLYNETELYKELLLHGQNYDQIISFSFILLSLYIAVPSQSLIVKPKEPISPSEKPEQPETTKSEPEVENVQ